MLQDYMYKIVRAINQCRVTLYSIVHALHKFELILCNMDTRDKPNTRIKSYFIISVFLRILLYYAINTQDNADWKSRRNVQIVHKDMH
jgi:hypothetical protein